MKKLIASVIACCMAATTVLALPVNAADNVSDVIRYYVDGVSLASYNTNPTSTNTGYLYIMEDAADAPVLDDIAYVNDLEGKYKYYDNEIPVTSNILSKYGDDILYSTQLAQDMTGVSKVIQVNVYGHSFGSIQDNITIALNFDSLEEYEANKDQIFEDVVGLLPDDGYGYKIVDAKIPTSGKFEGKVTVSLYSVAELEEVETDVSKIFNQQVVDTLGEFNTILEFSKKIEQLDYVYGSMPHIIIQALLSIPNIYAHVHQNDEIIYNVVYSADGSAGDANNDGLLELADVQTLLSHKANSAAGITEPIVSATPDNMDVDGDGEVTIKDAQYLLTYCAQQAAGMNPTWESVINA